jgi:phosphate/sulfate permease
MVGFGLVYGGVNAVFWSSLAKVSSSWVISPIMGAAASFIVYKCIRRVSSHVKLVYFAGNIQQEAKDSISNYFGTGALPENRKI